MRQRGFTLLEMVVALAIFSIMAVIAYRGLTGILDAREALEQDSARLSRLTFAVALIERDVRQALPRPVRDELGDPEPALVGTVRLLALTRLGRSNPAQLAQASLERVEYGWADGTLRRIAWPVLDRAPNTEPQIQELISDLDGVQLRFLRGPDQWLDQWPPPATTATGPSGPGRSSCCWRAPNSASFAAPSRWSRGRRRSRSRACPPPPRPMAEPTRSAQRGVALITALLIVALATLAATAMAYRMQLDIRRAGNLAALERAHQYARGLEAWALNALREDARESAGRDSRQEPWAHALPVIELDQGRLRGRMQDLDGRFNLNNLFVAGTRQSAQIERLRRLLSALELNPALAEAIADWLDPDPVAATDGAEDGTYLRARPPYRAANRHLAHVSELRLISGVDREVYRRLEPHVSALPVADAPTAINVNSASVPVLMSLNAAITADAAERIHQDGQADFGSLTEFNEHPSIAALNLPPIANVSVDSRYFLAHGVIEIEQRVQHFYSLIEQGQRGFAVIQRSRGGVE